MKIGLCMIVRNEADRLVRCLESIRPVIDYAVIIDTGSNDATPEIADVWLGENDIPGKVFRESWRNFSFNRNQALEQLRCRSDIDYALIMDADDELLVSENFRKHDLTLDHYLVKFDLNGTEYWRIQLVSNRKPYEYRGVVHEFLRPPAGATEGYLLDLSVKAGTNGARSRDPLRFKRDALLIEAAMIDEGDPILVQRYTFYLAQSFRDAGNSLKAEETYLKRAEMGGFPGEVFVSLIQAARLMEIRNASFHQIIGLYREASRVLPDRAVEAIHGAARLCRQRHRFQDAYDLVADCQFSHALHGLFVERWIYQYGIYDEVSIAAYYAGDFKMSRDACEHILDLPEGTVDPVTLKRVKDNLDFATAAVVIREGRKA